MVSNAKGGYRPTPRNGRAVVTYNPLMAGAPAHEYRLAKTLGVLAITASAVSAEYGSGINYVSVQSLSVYPDVKGLVQLAMFVCGIAMLPKAYLFAAFSRARWPVCDNAAGIRHYGIFVTILMFVIVGVALLITAYGFLTPPETFVAAASKVAKVQLAPPTEAA